MADREDSSYNLTISIDDNVDEEGKNNESEADSQTNINDECLIKPGMIVGNLFKTAMKLGSGLFIENNISYVNPLMSTK